MEKKKENTIILGFFWGHIGIMEKKMENTIVEYTVYRDDGKDTG